MKTRGMDDSQEFQLLTDSRLELPLCPMSLDDLPHDLDERLFADIDGMFSCNTTLSTSSASPFVLLSRDSKYFCCCGRWHPEVAASVG